MHEGGSDKVAQSGDPGLLPEMARSPLLLIYVPDVSEDDKRSLGC